MYIVHRCTRGWLNSIKGDDRLLHTPPCTGISISKNAPFTRAEAKSSEPRARYRSKVAHTETCSIVATTRRLSLLGGSA